MQSYRKKRQKGLQIPSSEAGTPVAMGSDADTPGTPAPNSAAGPASGGGGGGGGSAGGTPRTTTGETFFGPDFNAETAALKLGERLPLAFSHVECPAWTDF